MFNAIYHAQSNGEIYGRDRERGEWSQAAIDKRIKTRKYPARGTVKVWIEPANPLSK